MFGLGNKVDYSELIKEGAIVLDVRTKGEYAGGHINGSINIPLDQLGGNLKQLKNKDHAIITCCASGMRSSSAKRLLEAQGYTNVHNGGSWRNLK
jgi:phage shock protein E